MASVTHASSSYLLTAQDIVNGFAVVPVSWRSPFYDTNYSLVYGVHDLDNIVDLSFEVGDIHDKTPHGFNAIVYLTASLPLIQGQLDKVNTSVAQSLTLTSATQTMYQLTIFYQSLGTAASPGELLYPLVTFTDVQGHINTDFTNPYLGPVDGQTADNNHGLIQNYSIPFLVEAGQPITVAMVFGGAYTFPYNVSMRLVRMPNNTVSLQPGDQFVVEAVAVHN